MASFSGALLVPSALVLSLAGCGSGGQVTGSDGAVKVKTVPGVVPPDQETSPPPPAK
jgi:hypothetical protein